MGCALVVVGDILFLKLVIVYSKFPNINSRPGGGAP